MKRSAKQQDPSARRPDERSRAGGTIVRATAAEHRVAVVTEFPLAKDQKSIATRNRRGHQDHHRRYPCTRAELDQEIGSCDKNGGRFQAGVAQYRTPTVRHSHQSSREKRPLARTPYYGTYPTNEGRITREEWLQYSSLHEYDIVLPGLFNDSHTDEPLKACPKGRGGIPSSYHPPHPWYQEDHRYKDGVHATSSPEKSPSPLPPQVATVREQEVTVLTVHRISESTDDQRYLQPAEQHITTTTTTMHTVTTTTRGGESPKHHLRSPFESSAPGSLLQQRSFRRPRYDREDSSVGAFCVWNEDAMAVDDDDEAPSVSRLLPKSRSSSFRRPGYSREGSSVGVLHVVDDGGALLLSEEEPQGGKPRGPRIPFPEEDMWANNTSGNGLALAHMVNAVEDGTNSFLVAAIEYDPDAKPAPPAKQRGLRTGLFLLFLFTSCIIAIVPVLGPPIREGIPYRETIGIREHLEQWLPDHGRLRDPNDPYGMACHWITHEDPLQIEPTNPVFYQRFALALVYFLTSQDGEWTDDCAPLQSPRKFSNRLCLLNHKKFDFDVEELGGATGRHWLSGTSECEWGGVGCDAQGAVYRISLVAAGLNGRLPEELTLIPSLKSLNLGGNRLTGNISNDFVQAQKHLIVFSSWENSLTGTLPRDLFVNAKTIEVQDNRLEGNLSLQAPNLKHFEASKNLLTGSLPHGFGNGKSLAGLLIDDNFLSSSIPESLMGPELFVLSLENNNLQGPIHISQPPSMKIMRLGSNELTGTIPHAFSCPSCLEIDLSNNMLTGTLEDAVVTAVQESSALVHLKLTGNQLSGTIPSALATVPELVTLHVEGNHFEGSMPSALCALERAEAGFDAIALSANCRSSNNDGILPQVECSCCTTCCDANGRNCVDAL